MKSQSRSAGSAKTLWVILGSVAAVFVILVIVVIGAFVIFSGGTPKYVLNDLVPVVNNNIQFSRPVQWQDVSYASNLKKDFGLEVSDASIYGEKIVKDSDGNYDIAGPFVIFGLAGGEPVDLSVLKTTEFRTKFEEAMNKQLQPDSFESGSCVSVSNYGKNFNYDLNGMPVSVAIKLNCRLAESERAKFNADSIEMRIAIVVANDGKTYLYALAADDKSWSVNEPIYLQMLKDFKAL